MRPLFIKYPDSQRIEEKIRQRRWQMIYHSHAYYRYNFTMVEDSKFDEWARELANLQAQHPEIAEKVIFADIFEDWDGSTGYHLIDVERVHIRSKLYHQLRYRERLGEELTVEQLNFLDEVDRGIV